MLKLDKPAARECVIESLAATIHEVACATMKHKVSEAEGYRILRAIEGLVAIAVVSTATTDEMIKDIQQVFGEAYARVEANLEADTAIKKLKSM